MNTSETGDGGEYVHRMMRTGQLMRCKPTGSFLYKGRRYRPGEYVEVELPPELAEFVEPAPPKVEPVAPVPVKPTVLRVVKPPPGAPIKFITPDSEDD